MNAKRWPTRKEYRGPSSGLRIEPDAVVANYSDRSTRRYRYSTPEAMEFAMLAAIAGLPQEIMDLPISLEGDVFLVGDARFDRHGTTAATRVTYARWAKERNK